MDTTGLWQAVLGEIELSVSQGNYVTWFKNTRLLKISDDSVVVGAPNIFICQQLENKFNQLIDDTLKNNGVIAQKIEYKILPASSLNRKIQDETIVLQTIKEPSQNNTQTTITSSLTHTYRQGINEQRRCVGRRSGVQNLLLLPVELHNHSAVPFDFHGAW